MAKTNYLIVGGGIAGTTAAETIRQHDKEGTIFIVSDEPYPLYSRIMLSKPNFFLEKIPFEQIWLKKDSWYEDNKIGLLMGRKAVKFDPVRKIVSLDDGAQLHYEKLLLAIGGCTRKWDIPGSDKGGVFYLRTLNDAKAIISAVKSARSKGPRQAVAIGGGFVSFEMCDMMHLAGLEVKLVIREPYYWASLLDETSGRMIEEALGGGGIKIFRNSEAREVIGGEKVEGLILKDGTQIPCEIIIVGIGVFCPIGWIKEAGIKVNRGILANEYLETNMPGIWTAGDAAEFTDLILGEQIQLGNWVNAQMQGKIAGLNMLGKKEPFRLVSFYTTQGFGINIAFVGDTRLTESRKTITRGSRDFGYYVRLIVNMNNGKLVGATLINRTQELGLISKIIERGINILDKEDNLSDPSFNISSLL